jgi:hypothetical protein
VSLRLRTAARPERTLPTGPVLAVVALGAALLTAAFLRAGERWTDMTVALGSISVLALAFRGVRRQLVPTRLGVALGLASGVAFYLLARLVVGAFPALRPEVAELMTWRGEHGLAFLLATLTLALVPGEELLWRGLLQRLAAERLGPAAGILLGALGYALCHLATGNALLPAAALGLGLAWGWLAHVTRGLAAPIASHLMFDALVLFVAPLA